MCAYASKTFFFTYNRTLIALTPMANSNSFLSPYKILPIAQENKYLYLREFSYFVMKLYVVCTHWNCLNEAILMSTINIQLLCRKSKNIP